MNIEIENFSKSAREADLKKLFRKFGDVDSVRIWHDPRTGKSEGIGWVDMPHESEAARAIEALNGRRWKGKKLNVHEKPSYRIPFD